MHHLHFIPPLWILEKFTPSPILILPARFPKPAGYKNERKALGLSAGTEKAPDNHFPLKKASIGNHYEPVTRRTLPYSMNEGP
jgi:hypothetical protein